MHLLVVTSLYPTADRPEVGPFVAQRVAALRAAGQTVTVVAATSYRPGPVRRHLSMIRKVIAGRGIHVDGVEGHVLFPSGLVAALAARLHRVPLVLYAHGSDVAFSATRSPAHRFLARLAAHRAAAVVTNASGTLKDVAELGVAAHLVPPGVDLDWYRPGDRSVARRQLGLPPDRLVALFLGRLEKHKGPDVFAEALSRASNWIGVVVGDGPMDAALRERWPQLRHHRAVPPQDVRDWLRAADVVVVPSRRESLGLAAIEALACGVPVIATHVGGLGDVVIDQANGRLVESEDISAIAAALDDLVDPLLRARLGEAARASVSRYDLRTTTAQMAEIWTVVAGEP